MLFVEKEGNRICNECGGEMRLIEEIPQTTSDHQDVSDDSFVCRSCGRHEPVEEDIFLKRLDTVIL